MLLFVLVHLEVCGAVFDIRYQMLQAGLFQYHYDYVKRFNRRIIINHFLMDYKIRFLIDVHKMIFLCEVFITLNILFTGIY